MKGSTVDDYAEDMARMKALPEGFTIIKQGISFHSAMPSQVPDFFYGDMQSHGYHVNRGPLTEKGLNHLVACIEAMKSVLGDEVGLALDCGPGMLVPDALRPGQGRGTPARDVAGRHDNRRLYA